jgi:hypothetical protein
MATNQHATSEELLEALFFVGSAAAAVMQWCGKRISLATVELQ